MKRKLKFAEIPEKFKDMELSNFRADVYKLPKSKEAIREACNIVKVYMSNFEQQRLKGMGLYVFSKTKGSGKTRMIVSIANELIKNYQVKFAPSTSIIKEIKNTYDKNSLISESKLLEDLANVDILIIDDFGAEKITEWVNERFYSIVNERYINQKVTIYTSNERLAELQYDERITSRIKEKVYEIAFPEESVREHIAVSNNEEILKRILG